MFTRPRISSGVENCTRTDAKQMGSDNEIAAMSTPLNPLDRFLQAQARDYAQALAELRAGRKRTHWIWYVLPQWRPLGHSAMGANTASLIVEQRKVLCLADPDTRVKRCLRRSSL
ncbi:hypothetical protein Tamer19_12240 [Cupriavidus sp. TA19]|nr:hypothetical protein CTP10_R81330 [Cupriavidus sp. P-10]GLC91816.1 hypothetical protein Tamer19_12240 [Cupriavidus sp. TA19]